MSERNITIADIAREAGVSKTTASFYINGKSKMYNLADSTCARIEDVIKKYNFSPNIHAKAINSGRTYLVGVVVGNINQSFWTDIISGIESAIEKYQYHMLLTVSHHSQEREEKLLEFLDKKGVDGYIYSPVVTDAGIPNLSFARKLAEKKPMIAITYPVEGMPVVYNDNYLGGRIAAEYLYGKGHVKVASMIGDHLHRRQKGFVEYYKEHGIDVALFNTVDAFLNHAQEFTGMFCFSDYKLLELYDKAKNAGIKIPQDISVIGYDNMDFIKFINPAPATIHQYKNEIGFQAGKLLMEIINGENHVSEEIRFEPKLIEGKSVGKIKTDYSQTSKPTKQR